MKKLLLFVVLIINMLYSKELPSYQCVDKYEATFIESNGKIKPKTEKTSGNSKLNILIEENKKDVFLNVNGSKLLVTDIKEGYIYAIEFTGGGMNTWVLFKNKKDKKTYLTVSKTYSLLGTPLTSYSLYACEQVNNKF